MLNAIIRSARTQTPTTLLFLARLPSHIGRSTSGLRFRQAEAGANQPQKLDIMEKQQQRQQKQTNDPNTKTGDVMSHSFGEAYATRSDEEGFGGIYGGNQSLPKAEHDRIVHENNPAYDKSQGSEVAEKERGRHQKTADC